MTLDDFLMLLLEREPWRAEANCIGVPLEFFYPDLGGPSEPAKELCAECAVSSECEAAGQREDFGIWGGLSMSPRSKDKRRYRDLREQHATVSTLRAPASEPQEHNDPRLDERDERARVRELPRQVAG